MFICEECKEQELCKNCQESNLTQYCMYCARNIKKGSHSFCRIVLREMAIVVSVGTVSDKKQKKEEGEQE